MFPVALNISTNAQLPAFSGGSQSSQVEDDQRYQNVQDDVNSASVSVKLSGGEVVAPVSVSSDVGSDQSNDNAQSSSNAQEQPKANLKSEELSLSQEKRELEAKLAEEIRSLKSRDQEVRQHEQAHATRGGLYAGSPKYEFTQGPDGLRYAVNGSVSIDLSPIPGDPQATIEKAEVVRAAALAPKDPSPADRQVAAEASQLAAKAQVELLKLQQQENELKDKDTAQSSDQAQGAESAESVSDSADIETDKQKQDDKEKDKEKDKTAIPQDTSTALDRYLEIFGSDSGLSNLSQAASNQSLVSQFLDALA